jgi:xanthine dehydrogenase iron-sulfur cluster and FAD-binding subunit A
MSNPFITLEMHRFESDCDSAAMRVRVARTIAEVLQIKSSVVAPAIIRCLIGTSASKRRLSRAAQDRAEAIVQSHLDELRKLADDPEALELRIGRLRAGDWRVLAGNYPALAHRSRIESTRLLQNALRSQTAIDRDPSGGRA